MFRASLPRSMMGNDIVDMLNADTHCIVQDKWIREIFGIVSMNSQVDRFLHVSRNRTCV
jgi:hypothetical protein